MKPAPQNDPQTVENVTRFLDHLGIHGVEIQPWPYPDDYDRSRVLAIDTRGELWARCRGDSDPDNPSRAWDRDDFAARKTHAKYGVIPECGFRYRASPSMQCNFIRRRSVQDGRLVDLDTAEVEIDFDYWSPLMGPGAWVKHAFGEYCWNLITRSQTDPQRVKAGLDQLLS